MNILYQEQVMDTNGLYMKLALLFTIIGVICSFLSISNLININEKARISILIFGLLFGITALTIIAIDNKEPTLRRRYYIAVDRDTDFKLIYDKFDIVERKGGLWVIDDKEVINLDEECEEAICDD